MKDTVSDAIRDWLEELPEPSDPGDNEYKGDNGLLYCGQCHTPVQYAVEIFGRKKIVPCICKCRQEKREAEQERFRLQEEKRQIQRLKATGIQDRHLLDWRFEVAKDTREIQMAKRYVENWNQVREKNLGLLLWGDVGTGKSFVAACIANALLEQGVPVLMTNFSKILNQMGALYSEERYQYIASFSHFPLLILDDLGIERSTEYAMEQVYAVIDERYKSGLPVIITSNLMINEIRNPADVAHARIYSRVLEMCTPVHVKGMDRRIGISKEKNELIKEVFEL